MAGTIQLRRGLAANWTSANPTLAQGELGWEIDTQTFKVGDGTTAWNDLPYIWSKDKNKQYVVAGEALSALRVVKGDTTGGVFYCDTTDADRGLAIGVTATAASLGGLILIVTDGFLSDGSWSWDTTKPIYLGASGVLTQTVPTTGYNQIVGTPMSPTSIKVSINQPIKLS